jgi:hypothetical protein
LLARLKHIVKLRYLRLDGPSRLALILCALLAASQSGAQRLPHSQAQRPGGGLAPVASLSLSSFSLPATANTIIGSLTTTFTDGTTATGSTSIVSGGTSADGAACPTTTDFTISGTALQTSSTYTSRYWDYVCVKTAPPGRTPFTQLMFLPRTQPQHTAVVAIGDANTTGSPAWPKYDRMLGPDYGWSVSERGTGDTMTACSASLGTIIGDATGTINADYRSNPAYLLNFGFYEANSYGAGRAGETAFKDCLTADARWLLVPDANKQKAAAITSVNKTGTWTNYTKPGLSPGTCLQSSDVSTPASITFSVNVVAGNPVFTPTAYPSGHIYVWWGAVSTTGTNTGTSLNYAVDASSPTSVTPDDYQTRAAAQTLWLHELANGTHTVTLTLSALGPNTSAIIVCGAGTPPRTWATKVELGGVPKAQSGRPYSAYDLDIGNIAADLDRQKLDVIYSPTRNYVNTTTDWNDATHLSASGQVHMAQAYSENLYKCIAGAVTPTLFDPTTVGYTCPIFNENNSHSIDIYSGSTPTAGFNWYAAGSFPRETNDPDWYRNTPSPITHAQLGDGCCTLRYSFTGYIDNGNAHSGSGTRLTIVSGSGAGDINGGAVLTGAGVTAGTTVVGLSASNSTCSASTCSVTIPGGVPIQVGPIAMTATYTGQYIVPTVTGSGQGGQVPMLETCGVPVGASANTPPFIVGKTWGLGFYNESISYYPTGITNVFWNLSADFFSASPNVNLATGLPRESHDEEDKWDTGSGQHVLRLWTTVAGGNVVAEAFASGPKQSGVATGILAENAVDGGGTENLTIYSGASSPTQPAGPGYGGAVGDWNLLWEEHNCDLWSSLTNQALVVGYDVVWQRPL